MKTRDFVTAAMIAAAYTAVSFVPGLNSLAFGPIQIRLAEALTMLPLLSAPAVTGVTLGCFLTNLLGTASGLTGPMDIFFGTLATFFAALITRKCRNLRIGKLPLLSILAPVILNFFIVGLELALMLNPDRIFTMMWIYGAQVALGELAAVLIGLVLVRALEKAGLFRE